MIKGKKWAALFSHTGSEIVNISNIIGRTPDVIITNNPPGSERIHEGIRDNVYVQKKPTVMDYRNVLQDVDIVTLHGWMRIIPQEICKEYKIYNLHPGLITLYPELKGADPQKKVAMNEGDRYKRVGCVIHKAVPEVDAGEILAEMSTLNHFYGEADLSCHLHDMATQLWIQLLNTSNKK